MTIDVAMVFPNTFPDMFRWEGSRTRVSELASGLASMGLKVALVCIKSSSYTNNFDGVLLSYLGRALPLQLHYVLFPITSSIRLPSLLKKLKPKIVHFHMPTSAFPALFYSSLTDKAVSIYDPHDLFFLKEEFSGRLNKVPFPLVRLCDVIDIQLLKRFEAIFVTTPLMRNFIRKYAEGKIYVIPNSIDTQLFSASGADMRHLFSSDFVIGYLGAPKQLFGFYELVKAAATTFRKLGDIKILVVGSYGEEAISLVKSYNVEDMFYFTGQVQRQDVPIWLRTMDIGVSLLQRRSPNLEIGDFCQPIKVLEYMACGVPVVATPMAEQARLIKQSNAGIVSEGFSSDAIIDAIMEVYNNRGNLTYYGTNGRRYVVANHDWKVVAKKALRAYIDLEPSLSSRNWMQATL